VPAAMEAFRVAEEAIRLAQQELLEEAGAPQAPSAIDGAR
jgi:hypothetical protein